jgi:hypothetical protein
MNNTNSAFHNTSIESEVERALDSFIDEFIRFPYLHRAEHSIHAQLFHIMMKSPGNLSKHFIMGSGETTQLIHKEWPWPDKGSKPKRATFDFAILTPEYIKNGCKSLEDFCEGHTCPPIIIEIGLDYDIKHLKKDNKKLEGFLKSGHQFKGYLIHLTRNRKEEDPQVESLINNIPSTNTNIKTVYAFVNRKNKKIRYKKVNDQFITSRDFSHCNEPARCERSCTG